MTDDDLTTSVRDLATSTVLALMGDLDYHTAPLANSALNALSFAPGRQLVMDLDGLTFCDSSGIGVLVAGYNLATTSGGAFALSAVPLPVARTLAAVGLTAILTIHPTTSAAVAAWPAPTP